MALQAGDVVDLVALTLKDLGRFKFTDLQYDLQRHVAYKELIPKHKVKFDSGYAIQRQAQMDDNGQAAWVGLMEEDQTNISDTMQSFTIPWRHIKTDMAIEERMVKMNASPAKIVDYVKTQRCAAMIGYAKAIEDAFWDKPSSSSDELLPFGVKYWIVTHASTGFNGGNPSGFTSGAGDLSSTTYPRWSNYTAQYVDINKTDLLRKMRVASRKTDFRPPVDVPTYAKAGKGNGYYTNNDVVTELEEVAEQQNDKLGRDVDAMGGKVLFQRNPVVWVPKLDSDTTDPVYGIDWSCFEAVFLRGEYMLQTGPQKSANRHRVIETFWDSSINFCCTNRRRQFVISK